MAQHLAAMAAGIAAAVAVESLTRTDRWQRIRRKGGDIRWRLDRHGAFLRRQQRRNEKDAHRRLRDLEVAVFRGMSMVVDRVDTVDGRVEMIVDRTGALQSRVDELEDRVL